MTSKHNRVMIYGPMACRRPRPRRRNRGFDAGTRASLRCRRLPRPAPPDDRYGGRPTARTSFEFRTAAGFDFFYRFEQFEGSALATTRLHRGRSQIWESATSAHRGGGNRGVRLGVGLAPGGVVCPTAPPRRAPHHSGEGPWPNQCARVFSCAGRDLAPSLVGRGGNCISLQGRRIGSDSGPLGGATRCAIARSTSIASAANDATGRITIPLMTFRCTPSSLRH